jgi:isochorismate hydrolase
MINNIFENKLDELYLSGVIKNRLFDKIDKNETALIVIDMQNYFLDPTNKAYFLESNYILNNINYLINYANKNKIQIIYTIHYNSTNDNNMNKWWKNVPKINTNETQIFNKIKYIENSLTIYKETYSAFKNTRLDEYLSKNNLKNLIICGVKTNLCCETTARDAFVNNYNVILMSDATITNNIDLYLASLSNLSYGFSFLFKTNEINNLFR